MTFFFAKSSYLFAILLQAVAQTMVKGFTGSFQRLMYFTKKQDARAEEEKEKHKIQVKLSLRFCKLSVLV